MFVLNQAMNLDISKLEHVHVRARGQKTIARCPACAETGNDRRGEHLVINEDGRFGCVLYPGKSPDAKAHRKQIFALCGDFNIKPLIVRQPPFLGRLGRLGRQKPHTQRVGKTKILEFLEQRFSVSLRNRYRKLASLPSCASSKGSKPTLLALEEIQEVFPNAQIIEVIKGGKRRPVKKCVVCGVEYVGWPASEYCGNRCASADRKHTNPSKERIRYLRQQCRLSWQRRAESAAPEDFETWLSHFRKHIQRKPDDNEERPSIIRAITDWHDAHPEMRLKSAKEQWQQWQRLEASMIYANRNQ